MNDTLSPSGDTMSPHRVPASPAGGAVSPPPSPPAWNVAEIVALLSLAAVSIAAFSWSAIALHGVAVMSGIDSKLAWGAPVIVDGPIIQAAFSLVALDRRAKIGVPIPKSTRRFFWIELAAAELVSLVGNGVHAWTSDNLKLAPLAAAAVAGAAPIAALAVTHALTALMEVPRAPEPEATPVVTEGDAVATSREEQATPTLTEATAPDQEATPESPDPTAERDAQVWRLHQAGHSYREIAPLVGLHPGTVGKVVNRLKAERDDSDTGDGLRLLPGGSPQLALPSSN